MSVSSEDIRRVYTRAVAVHIQTQVVETFRIPDNCAHSMGPARSESRYKTQEGPGSLPTNALLRLDRARAARWRRPEGVNPAALRWPLRLPVRQRTIASIVYCCCGSL